MRIAFLVPNYSGHVVGSLLVYYRFARELARRGHRIDVFHPAVDSDESRPLALVRAALWAWRKNSDPVPVPWHRFEPGVRPRFVSKYRRLPLDHDIAIGFSWRGIEALEGLRFEGARFGYVVEYETWVEAEPARRSRMEKAYRSGPLMLTSSSAVEDMLRSVGVADVRSCVHGVDLEHFDGGSPPSRRLPRIGFPVRTESVKSPEVLRSTLEILRRDRRSGMVLWGFGRPDAPASITGLLDEFHANPSDSDLADLYSRSAIFAVPSRKEGFGMPAAEAMAAGCAVVSTDNGGIHTFGHDGIDCRIVPPNSPEELAAAILSLADEPDRRVELATRAPEAVSFLSWRLAGDRLATALSL